MCHWLVYLSTPRNLYSLVDFGDRANIQSPREELHAILPSSNFFLPEMTVTHVIGEECSFFLPGKALKDKNPTFFLPSPNLQDTTIY
jgi:hypothetical protein